MKSGWIVGLVAVLVAVQLLYGTVRHFTSAAYVEKKLSAAIASANGVNRVRIGSLRFNPLRRSIVAGNLAFMPDTLLLARRAQAGPSRHTHYAVTVSSLRAHGVHFWPLVRGTIVADSITVDGVRVDVSLDRTAGPARPAKHAILPQVSFQALERPILVDTIRMTNAAMTYSEIASDGSRPGTIRFSDMTLTISNLTNDSARMRPKTPCTIHVSTLINEAGRLDATFGYDLLSPLLSMTCRGTVSRMDAEPLNDLLVNLEGIRITSGVMDSTSFDFNVSDDVARGEIQVLYRGLGIKMLDKITLKQGLGARLQTLIADKVTLNHDNPADHEDPATVAVILRERGTETPLLKFLWETLRAGILSTLGVTEARAARFL